MNSYGSLFEAETMMQSSIKLSVTELLYLQVAVLLLSFSETEKTTKGCVIILEKDTLQLQFVYICKMAKILEST